MKYSHTAELPTFWSHYKCVDRSCPGKHRSLSSVTETERLREWTRLPVGRVRKVLRDDATGSGS